MRFIMAVITYKKRKKLKKSTFALPNERKYPITDKSHAINAKARAKAQFNKGNMSKITLNKIVKKADAKLGKSKSSAPTPKKRKK